MGKRRPSNNPAQMGLFDPPIPARADGDLAGLDRVVAAKVALILHDDHRSRHELAGALSALLDEAVSKLMLDAYASEARDTYNISAARLLALIAVTKRFDVLDDLVHRIGAALLVGDEVLAAQLGNLQARRRRIDEEIRKLTRMVTPIERGTHA